MAFEYSKPGRQAKPTTHPLGARLRQSRERLGLTVRDLATRVGLNRSSASYISQLETGAKTPHRGLAERLAQALDDDPAIYIAWAALGRRSQPVEIAAAVRTLAEAIGYPAAPPATGSAAASVAPEDAVTPRAVPAPVPEHEPGTLPAEAVSSPTTPRFTRSITAIPAHPAGGGSPRPRVLVPELPEGADPAEDARGGPPVVATHRVDADSLAGVEPLVRPFAYRVSADGVRRVRDALRAGDLAIVTRRFWPLEPGAPCVVRAAAHTLLARVLWNGRQLLLLPGGDDSDFVVLEAHDRTALERLLAGRVVAVVRGGA